jgi:Rrf2 family iron-sulfur cluster assembly transcriptional regulator
MLDLAMAGASVPVSLKDIAARQDISMDYLEQLLRKLRKASLVRSVRGPRGGFMLARTPREITLWEIVAALEQDVTPVRCVDEEILGGRPRKKCERLSGCATHVVWLGLARQTKGYLESKTLQDVLELARRMCDEAEPGRMVMFHI